MLITNDKYQMSEINSSHYSVQMRLIIRRIQKHDLGGYKCISKNSIGDAEGNIRLYVIPSEIDNHQVIHLNSDTSNESIGGLDENNVEGLGSQGPLRERGGRIGTDDSSSKDVGFLGGPMNSATLTKECVTLLYTVLILRYIFSCT